ncbi:uncharacterized protein Dwil_GK27861 [Drosophila willistoni]|uniref:Nose resistant-to-fluoxetine protein N-terminal domain-containing protein n=1 Tax=Drosophila willistoni TaxID=7260 RepID=A0A0Q9WPS0_DROWI|nr:uncharacterized protein Dwil_GK27861 [Drosophila willistoni]
MKLLERVIDSWGSLPSGVLYGNYKDLGNYDECRNINQEITSTGSVTGKYCFAALPKLLLGLNADWSKTIFSEIFGLSYAVDSFFFITGLLLVFCSMRTFEKSKGNINVFMLYLHRYLRLTPLVVFSIPIYMKILPLLADGPFTGYEDYNASCKKTWYKTLLYVQNYSINDVCLSHTWYLAADMHLYVVSVPLVIALYKWGKKAVVGILVLISLLAVCLFFAHYIMYYRTPLNLDYFASHTHASPFLIGLLCGYFLHINRGRSYELHRIIISNLSFNPFSDSVAIGSVLGSLCLYAGLWWTGQ